MSAHPIHAKDPDIGCRWLCMSYDRRTRADDEEIRKALAALPYPNGPVPAAQFPMDPGQIWKVA